MTGRRSDTTPSDWYASDEFTHFARRRNAIVAVNIAIVLLLALLCLFAPTVLDESPLTLTYIFLIVAAVITVIGLAWISNLRSLSRDAFDTRFRDESTKRLQERERKVAESAGSEDKTVAFAELWAVTQERIDYYHEIAITQSRRSFQSGQIAAFVGFSLVVVLGAVAGLANSVASAVAAGAIGIAGTALSGYIGSTFMKSQAESAAQLRQFFAQPVEFSRVLAAERLVEALDPTARGDAVAVIIKSMMTPVAAAPAASPTPSEQPTK